MDEIAKQLLTSRPFFVEPAPFLWALRMTREPRAGANATHRFAVTGVDTRDDIMALFLRILRVHTNISDDMGSKARQNLSIQLQLQDVFTNPLLGHDEDLDLVARVDVSLARGNKRVLDQVERLIQG